MNAITKAEPALSSSNPMMPHNLDDCARLAKIMSEMALVPAHLQGKPADCMLIIELAIRWRMSPFAVAQASSVLQGKLNLEGKLVAAALQTSGILATRLRYDFAGEGDQRSVLVSATVHGETEPREVLVKLKDVKTSNRMWVSQVDQQLCYSGSRIWGRRHAPEVMLGVYSPEEFDSSSPPDDYRGTTIDAHSEPAPPRPQPVRSQPAADPIPDFNEPLPPKDNAALGTNRLVALFVGCGTLDELKDHQQNPEKAAWIERMKTERPELYTRITDAIRTTYAKLTADEEAPLDDADQGEAGEP